MNMFDIVQTIFNFFSMLYIHRFMTAFFDNAEKRNFKYLLCLYFVYPLLTSIVYFEANYPIINLAANVIALFIISFQYRTGLGQRIVAVGLTFFCMVSVESACVAATNYLGVSAFQSGTYKNIAGLVAYNLIIFTVSLIIHNFKNMKKNILMPRSYWIAISGIPTISIVSILIILHSGKINQLQALIVICAFAIINGFVFYLYDALVSTYNLKIQSALLAEEKEYYYNQCQYMLQSEKEMNSFRHDVRNQLDMIYELLKHESKNRLNEYRVLKYYSDMHKAQNENIIAIEYLHKCINIISELNDEKILADLYINLGELYSDISKEKELEYYQKGVCIPHCLL